MLMNACNNNYCEMDRKHLSYALTDQQRLAPKSKIVQQLQGVVQGVVFALCRGRFTRNITLSCRGNLQLGQGLPLVISVPGLAVRERVNL